MPRSAIDSGCVDFVLPPAEIAKELLRLHDHPYLERVGDSAAVNKLAEDSTLSHDSDLAIILEHLQKVTTVNFREYKPSTIYRRALRRAAILRLNSLREYANYLTDHPEEGVRLYDDI